MTQTITRVAITGNTYPVRTQLRALGGEWNAAEKAWMVPEERVAEARALVSNRGAHGERAAARETPHRDRYGSRYTRFAGGGEHYVNRRGRCEDAPCCGCCS